MSSNQQDMIRGAIAFVSVNSDFINASKCELSQKSFTQGQSAALFFLDVYDNCSQDLLSCRKMSAYFFKEFSDSAEFYNVIKIY